MGVSDARGCHAVTRCMIMHGGRDGSVTERDAGCRPLSLTFSIEGGIKGRAHGCRLGADGLGDRARYGRPAGRPALAGRRGRALFAGKYQAIPFVGAQLLGVAVCGARHQFAANVCGVPGR